jgi:hypothetical protein
MREQFSEAAKPLKCLLGCLLILWKYIAYTERVCRICMCICFLELVPGRQIASLVLFQQHLIHIASVTVGGVVCFIHSMFLLI